MKIMDAAIIIPARFQSSRFPGKPLTPIVGKSLIQRVWERCVGVVPSNRIYIATDDERIRNHCATFGAETLMTSSRCLTGTDRVAEAAEQIQSDLFVNVQGDEPLISPEDVRTVLQALQANPHVVHNAFCPIEEEDDFLSRNVPKVVTAPNGKLLYMSRAAIPANKEGRFGFAFRQVCIYGFTRQHLRIFTEQKTKTPLEASEDIEILRFLESGIDVQMTRLGQSTHAVDVPEDVLKIEEILKKQAGNDFDR
jgi:3-deoxy-manno-octulosonate cytidylyltransferase (CMP-KDO synthetase)